MTLCYFIVQKRIVINWHWMLTSDSIGSGFCLGLLNMHWTLTSGSWLWVLDSGYENLAPWSAHLCFLAFLLESSRGPPAENKWRNRNQHQLIDGQTILTKQKTIAKQKKKKKTNNPGNTKRHLKDLSNKLAKFY